MSSKLTKACKLNDLSLVKEIISNGEHFQDKDAFIEACSSGHIDIVKLLLDAGLT